MSCFDRVFNSTHQFGKGVYFARDASYVMKGDYSKPDSNGKYHILYCEVFCGEWVVGKEKDMRPSIKPGKKEEYESMVNVKPNPEIIVACNDGQAYPVVKLTIVPVGQWFFSKVVDAVRGWEGV